MSLRGKRSRITEEARRLVVERDLEDRLVGQLVVGSVML